MTTLAHLFINHGRKTTYTGKVQSIANNNELIVQYQGGTVRVHAVTDETLSIGTRIRFSKNGTKYICEGSVK